MSREELIDILSKFGKHLVDLPIDKLKSKAEKWIDKNPMPDKDIWDMIEEASENLTFNGIKMQNEG